MASAVLVVIASVMDVRNRRIPNGLTYPAIAAGLGLAFMQGGTEQGVMHALALCVALPFAILFYMGLFGGGDVKLIAAIGALLGPAHSINIAVGSLLVGGVCALLILIWRGDLLRTLVREGGALVGKADSAGNTTRDSFPFAVAIAVSTLSWCIIAVVQSG
jgi:prepilin peptidase CpaA